MNRSNLGKLFSLFIAAGLVSDLNGQTSRPIEIRTTCVRDNVYMLAGAGGNLGVCVGKDGVLLIDSEYEGLTDKVIDAVKAISDQPIRFVINTHWHFDHVGGNVKLAEAGAVIVAHEKVRTRMGSEQYLLGIGRKVPPSPRAALPRVTYTERLKFHWNGDEVTILHAEPAHTDGDSLVLFPKANVLHMGDIYFASGYPFIDINAGGSIEGMIKGVDQALALVNDETKIIPGHGPLSDVSGLRTYRAMLVTVRDRVRALVEQGKSREEAIASKLTADLDAEWSGALPADRLVGIVYDGMTRKESQQGGGPSPGADGGL